MLAFISYHFLHVKTDNLAQIISEWKCINKEIILFPEP